MSRVLAAVPTVGTLIGVLAAVATALVVAVVSENCTAVGSGCGHY